MSSSATDLVCANLKGLNAESAFSLSSNVILTHDFNSINIDRYHKVLCLTLRNPSKENVLKAIKLLEKRDDILYVGPDYVVSLCSTSPNGEYCGEQWAIDKIKLPQAWDLQKGNFVLVGVIDSGIQGNHPDLSAQVNVSLSRDFTGGSAVAVSNVTDELGHGTHVAGIISARSDNTIGISGVAWYTRLVSLKVFAPGITTHSSHIAAAINYATSQGISILNYSGGSYEDEDGAMQAAIANYPGVFICAAGNNGLLDNDEYGFYPSNFNNFSHVISVGAFTNNHTKASYSHYGKTTVDLFAPGDSILSCYPEGLCSQGKSICELDGSTHYVHGYHKMNGTSMAAPHVTGVAALILSQYPSISSANIKNRIMLAVDRYSALSDYCVSGGCVSAYKALHAHSMSYTILNSNQHYYGCSCAAGYYENHTFQTITVPGSNGSAITKKICTKCGYGS